MLYIFILFILLSSETVIAKNDTVFISDRNKAIRFDAVFSATYSFHAKDDIPLIKKSDPENYAIIISNIKSIIQNDRTCDPNSVIPVLKKYGSLRHIVAYKKMFLIYYKQMKGLSTWAKEVFYITDKNGVFIYVEFKRMYLGKNMVFDHSILKDIKITKDMLGDVF